LTISKCGQIVPGGTKQLIVLTNVDLIVLSWCHEKENKIVFDEVDSGT
jgi:hypothetical protein